MAIQGKFVGREKLAKRLRELVPDLEEETAKAQLEAAEELAEAIEQRAPLGHGDSPGDYRASIRGGKLNDNPRAAVFGLRQTKDKSATGVFASFLWRWLEFGTGPRVVKKTGKSSGQMEAQPHIFPTYRQHQKRIRRKVANAINRAVRRMRKK
ncbi:HK97-gp10 family putative phage morphogenesis protein [Aquamicrobium defluvii]|uniref:HK97 gp10 family phage protein n=1 Tax=Aquamicrobium defluvii TaxID=69279 RepID=A0A011URW7_9HYPH|nr:HK97-gp10 family putative phage morphogenesis protein [Aquamicrobium defluvii]EXL08613.1 hypothetical protein BG36_03505 [Aquamicrobium defluvii]EZQ14875.1 hypothetical protein CF98_14895 [Halopseudomonas bauzanensis]